MEYSHNFGSNFPNSLIPMGEKLDVNNIVANLVKKYYSYIDAGDATSAKSLYDENKEALQPYIIDMEYINRLEEEIFNTGLSVLKKIKNEIADTEPLDMQDNGWWYQEY